VDAFDAGGMAAHLGDAEFFSLCQQHLMDKGIVSMNVWGTNPAEYQAASSAIQQVFPAVLKLPVEKKGNVILLAMARVPGGHWQKTLAQHARQLGQRTGLELPRFLNILHRVNTPLLRRLFSGS
jgi:spermidine synthase